MLQDFEWTQAVVRSTISKASTISHEDHRMELMEDDFVIIHRKMDKIDKKLSDLYRNWQAEYRNAVTPEDCDEVKKFYKSFLDKYESKYRILYQILQQMTRQADLADMPPTHEQTSDLTPSLVTLGDAQALMKEEWTRNEPGEEIPRQYSTPCGHLTSTQPRQDFMRMDSTLNITSKGSQNEYNILHTRLRGDVDQPESQQTPRMSEQTVADNQLSVTPFDRAVETPYTSVKALPGRTSDNQPVRTSRLFDEPRRIQRAREESQQDALESARHFFDPGNGQEQALQTRSSNEAPTTTIDATIETHAIATTSASTTTSTTLGTKTTNARTGGSSLFPPNGTTFRPTATATCRPCTWVLIIPEDWTGMPPL